MSKLLANLLAAREPLFSLSIQELERASGNSGVDVRLTAEIIQVNHQKIRELGLDPLDTTPAELYRALLSLVARHDQFLAKRIGAKDYQSVKKTVPKITAFVESLDIPKSALAIKHSSIKRLIKACPPKRVMKQLNYRSVDSMLKREPVAQIMAAIAVLESSSWQRNFIKKYAKLTASDFEMRPIDITIINNERWNNQAENYVKSNRNCLLPIKEIGVIAVLPLPFANMRGLVITLFPMLLHYINEIRLCSSLFKMHQIHPDFGSTVANTLLHEPTHHAVMAGQQIRWRVIHRYFGKSGETEHPEIFEPHLQQEDLVWRQAEEALYAVEPALHYWHGLSYVAHNNLKRPISFNMLDVALNYANNLPFGSHAIHHFRDSLWNEIYLRYLAQRPLEQHVLSQLTNNIVEPEISLL